ncbi:MAG TPA: ribbon-helix-helix protein, CopG family [bacterium]|nr:ribbon-helix-helix protein, CopG family [bacterium]
MKTDKKIMAYLPEDLYAKAKRVSQENEISIAEIIRRALAQYLSNL